MKKLYLSELAFILLSLLTQVRSESYNASFGRACSVSNNRLAPDTNQFLSDCGYAAWCDPSTNTCQKNGCRKDEYPFGMGPKSQWPPLCPSGQFCPDEGSRCMNLQAQGDPCQLNRDDECAPSSSSSSAKGVVPICLNLRCTQTDVAIGEPCQNDNTVYTVFLGGGATAGDVVSRDNCIEGAYCDYSSSKCLSRLDLSSPCSADKECISGVCSSSTFSFNSSTNGRCSSNPLLPSRPPAYAYVLVSLGIIFGSILFILLLIRLHIKTRRNVRIEREEFFNEEKKWRNEILQSNGDGNGNGWDGTFVEVESPSNEDEENWKVGDGGRSSSPTQRDASFSHRGDTRVIVNDKVHVGEGKGLRKRIDAGEVTPS